jgi:hypothetical protein
MLSLVLAESRLMLFSDFVPKRFRGKHFDRCAIFGDIEQQFTIVGEWKFKDIRSRLIK